MPANHDSVGDLQAKTGAAPDRFGCEKGLENTRLDRGGNPRSIVRNLDQDVLILTGSTNPNRPAALKGIDGIINQIRPDLIELAAIDHNTWQTPVIVTLHSNATFELERHDVQRVFQASMDVDILARRLIHVGIGFDRL